MSRTFEDRRRAKQEKEQRKQVHEQRLEAARREALVQDRLKERNATLREADRKEQRAEEARSQTLEARRAQARLELVARVQLEVVSRANATRQKEALRKQGMDDLRQAQIASRQDRAAQAQQKKQARKAPLKGLRRAESTVVVPPQPKPPKTDRKPAAKGMAAEQARLRRKEQAQAAGEQLRRERRQGEAQRLARKQLLAEQSSRVTIPSFGARGEARAEQLRQERNRVSAKELQEEQRRAQRRQEAADARKAEQRSAMAAEPSRKETPAPPRPPAAKLAERRAARKRAIAAAATQPPAPEEPLVSLPWLKVKGSFLVDEFLNAVYLRGVTCRGFDDVSDSDGRAFPAALSLDDPNLSTMIDLWGINIVRIPFQAATVLSGNASFAADQMLAGLDDIVGALTTANTRVLLSMEAPGSGPGTTPDSDTFRAWSLLANHYQDEPGVLYELFSSPQPLPDNWLDIAARLVGTIRLQNPASLIFLSNGRGGIDIGGLPLRFSTGDPVFNIVYTIAASDTLVPDPGDAQLRAFAAAYPLFASPWSDSNANADRSSEAAANLFSRYGMGWLAANWNADPRLVRSSIDHDFAPTRWGYVAQRALAQPVKPLLPSVRVEDETASAWRLA